MQLKPKLPPGRSSRKALRHLHEVRRLRAEGHTLESIRQALLDVGVSVSLNTVRREVVRPLSQWELERVQETPPALEELQPARVAPGTTPWPQQHGADRGRSIGPTGAGSGVASIEAVNDRWRFGLLFRVVAALRRLRRVWQLP